MKIRLIVLGSAIFILFSASAVAEENESFQARSGYYAAASLEDFDEYANYEIQGNRAAIKKMIHQKRLFSFQGSEQLGVQSSNPNFGNLIQVVSKTTGKTYWTTKDALIGGDRILATREGKKMRL